MKLKKATETWTKLANSMRDTLFWANSNDKSVLKTLGVKPNTITMVCLGLRHKRGSRFRV
jgi:hypothetical protein